MSKLIDMTGKRIGNFVVIERVVNPSLTRTRWLCLCDCGNYFECDGATLRRKEHPICCSKCADDMRHKHKAKDLTGMTFGHLKVIGVEKDEKGCYRQLCQCDCGNTVFVKSYSLLCGATKSCGCQSFVVNSETQKEVALKRLCDISGQKFGRLTPLRYDYDSHKWECQCDCGKLTSVSAMNLKQGITQSCGCLKSELTSKRCLIDIVGKRFGMLTVLSLMPEDKSKKRKWLCQCDCGEQAVVNGSDLKSGRQMSCGCLKSKGELLIKQYLTKHKISYQSQKSFDGLKGVGGGKLSYDFYLPDYELLIEFQGAQHYSPYKVFGGESKFARQKEHDKRKREYADKHHYELMEIKYSQLSKIDSILSSRLGLLLNGEV